MTFLLLVLTITTESEKRNTLGFDEFDIFENGLFPGYLSLGWKLFSGQILLKYIKN